MGRKHFIFSQIFKVVTCIFCRTKLGSREKNHSNYILLNAEELWQSNHIWIKAEHILSAAVANAQAFFLLASTKGVSCLRYKLPRQWWPYRKNMNQRKLINRCKLTIKVFHDLTTTREWQHCQLRFSHAIQNSKDQ